jgi:8-oxo-dGTP diphosphatase
MAEQSNGISRQPAITDASGRPFACFPTVVLVFIVNDKGQLLLFSDPARPRVWEVVKGAVEAGERVLDGALREVREETGPEVRVRPLGTVHTLTLYQDDVPYVVVYYLMAYEGGQVQPGDDLLGHLFRWWGWKELTGQSAEIVFPYPGWLAERAVALYHLWAGRQVDLQLTSSARRRGDP